MEKTARTPSADPIQERLRQNKATWNKEVSSFINDLIHFKKTMNGWPSKFFKERSRITQPIPADPATIIGSLAGDFQEIVNRGNGLIQEQINYTKNRRQKQPKPAASPGQVSAPSTPETTKAPDLTQQIQKGLTASTADMILIKLASNFEDKYDLEVMGSNLFSRFITRLFNPKFGFGEAARMRRLRMTMLDNCVKSYKEIKKLQKEIVKSNKSSIGTAHKMMTAVWNYWNIVNRLFSTYRAIRPNDIVTETGGPLEDTELKREQVLEEGRSEQEDAQPEPVSEPLLNKVRDYKSSVGYLSNILTKSPTFQELNSVLEKVLLSPKEEKALALQNSKFSNLYDKALQEVNTELGTNNTNFTQIVEYFKNKPVNKEAQLRKWLGKARHQILPGATSGPRLEVYNFINQIKLNLNTVMDLLEQGFDQEALTSAIGQVNRNMSMLRTTMRSLYYSQEPDKASSPFF